MGNEFQFAYDPIFYAQEALMVVEQAMGLASRVYRGFDEEKKSAVKGETISVRKPSSFTTNPGGSGVYQDLDTDGLEIKVDQWEEVKFKLSDKELSLHPSTIISDHIRPAAYAIAKKVNESIAALAKFIPWQVDIPDTVDEDAILLPRGIIRSNTGDLLNSEMLHYGIGDALENKFLKMDIFKNASVAGQGNNKTLFNGSLGEVYKVEHFVDQTMPIHTGGTVLSGADQAGALGADALKGGTTISITGFTGTETLKAGDSFVIAGNTQRYVVTSDIALTAGAATIGVYPKLVQDYPSASAVTFDAATTAAKKYDTNMMFHRNAFALAFAPLSEMGNGVGASMAVITDPKTKISIRSRIAYDDKYASVGVTLDALWGVKVLDDRFACIARRKIA